MRWLPTLAVALVLATPAAAQSAEAGPRTAPVELVIHNATPDAQIRCTLLLAHFFTVEVGRAAAGASLRLTVAHSADDGTLSVPGPTGEAMAIENVACGIDNNWSATWNHVPLAALRQQTTRTLRLSCTFADRLRCAATEG